MSRLPVLFTAHGSPMNALGGTPFAAKLETWAAAWPRPAAILCVSAHREETPLSLTAAGKPATVHDFYGFPRTLYELRYPAHGSPAVAGRAAALLAASGLPARLDADAGLDHGTWAPLLLALPAADVPVVQLSLPARSRLDVCVAMGRALAPLRDEGVLLLGSGNLVHNLREADLSEVELPVVPWAAEFDGWVAERISAGDVDALASLAGAPNARRAHPTLEHYAPVVACAAAAGADSASFPVTGFEHASLSLRCVAWS
ncbi:MAG: class III extradiol ring-cleavage dioxygenase [Thermoanaerobaculia bacterium]